MAAEDHSSETAIAVAARFIFAFIVQILLIRM
jgi:hypothetical protein